MKKLLLTLGTILALFIPAVAFSASYTIPWTATSTSNGLIVPLWNGAYQVPYIPYFVATSTTATSTAANGINLTGGCYEVNGTCLTSGATLSGGITNLLTYWTSPTTVSATGSPTVGYITATSTATSTITNLSGVLYADAFASSTSDMGTQINAAYAALPPTGGTIIVPPGLWVYTNPIVFGTNNKIVVLKGSGISGTAAYAPVTNGGTILEYTPSTGVAILVDTNYSSGGSKIEDLSIMGTNGTTARSSIGVQLGKSNGAFSALLEHIGISGFGIGLSYQNYTSFDTVDNSVINFNGRDIDEPSVGGANGENLRVTNSVIADSNNQAGGATDLYCIYATLSGNIQWTFINDSIDDCQVYSNQSGGTSNIWSFVDDHFENPNTHVYDYISTLSNQPAVAVQISGGDMMDDHVTGMPEFITTGAGVSLNGTTFDVNNNVASSTVDIVNFLDASNVDSISWNGIQQKYANSSATSSITYVYGANPFSQDGYGTGLAGGPSWSIAPANTYNGTTTIANLGGVLDATTFAGSDIGAKVNAAYASAAGKKSITISIPNGKYTFSTPIVFGTNGERAILNGTAAGGGVQLSYTGTGAAITENFGVQSAGIDHSSGCGVQHITLVGNNLSTTSPQIGILVGGTNGTDCSEDFDTNIEGFGYGLQITANAYHYKYEDGTIRNNGQDLHVNAASASGEDLQFINAFIVDGANHDPFDCIWFDNSATENTLFTGGSQDDCQAHYLQANNITEIGVSHENPGYSAWSAYTPILIDNNLATNVSINGSVFFNDATTSGVGSYPNLISDGGNVTLNGVIARQFGGLTITNAVVLTGSGRVTWNGLNNVSLKAFTNVVSGIPYSVSGTTGSTTLSGPFASLTTGTSTWAGDLNVTGAVTTSATSTDANGFNLTAGCFAVNGVCVGSGAGTVTAVTGTWPIVSSGGATPNITFGGLGTSSTPTNGQVPYFTSANTFASEATGTITCVGLSSCGAGSYVLGNNLTITGASDFGNSAFLNAAIAPLASTSTILYDTSGLIVSSSTNPISNLGGTSVQGQWPVLINNNTSTIGNSTGIGFSVSAAPSNAGTVGGYGIIGGGIGFIRQGNNSYGDLFFATTPAGGANTERMRIASNGNVGIASTSPYALLSVNANNGSLNTTLFAIGSSTASATTTLFSINNQGTTTAVNGMSISAGCFSDSGGCLTHSAGGTVTSVTLATPNSTLTLGGTNPVTTSGTINADLNLTHGNSWTGLQQFTNASTTQLSILGTTYDSLNSPGTSGYVLMSTATGVQWVSTTTIPSASAYKQAVNYATTGALPTNTYSNGVAGVGATLTEVGNGALSIDGGSPAVGQRVLIKNEASTTNNGIYSVTAAGSAIAVFVLTRTSDFNSSLDVYPGVATYVVSGTANGDTTWVLTSAAPITIGTTGLTFSELANGNITLPLSVANGGTGQNTLSSGQLLEGQGTNGVISVGTTSITLPAPLSGSFTVVGSASNPTFGTVAINQGGTNSTVLTNNTLMWYNGSSILSTSSQPLAVGSIVSTTTATSTFGGDINITGALTTSATSTLTAGINLKNGCFAVAGVCVTGGGGSGTVTSITLGGGLDGASPITTTGTITAQVGTSSVPSLGGLAWWSGVGTPSTLGTVATSSDTCTAPISCSGFTALGTGGAISMTGGSTNVLAYWSSATGLGATSSPTFGSFYASSTPGTATSTSNNEIQVNAGLGTPYYNQATTSTTNIDWSKGNRVSLASSSVAYTITFSNAFSGQPLTINECNPTNTTEGTITWPSFIDPTTNAATTTIGLQGTSNLCNEIQFENFAAGNATGTQLYVLKSVFTY